MTNFPPLNRDPNKPGLIQISPIRPTDVIKTSLQPLTPPQRNAAEIECNGDPCHVFSALLKANEISYGASTRPLLNIRSLKYNQKGCAADIAYFYKLL